MSSWSVVDTCGGCGSRDVAWEAGVLAPFLRGYALADAPNGIRSGRCGGCGLGVFDLRLGPDAIGRLYRGYRGEEYTRIRCYHEPWYAVIADGLSDVEGSVLAERKGLIDDFLRSENGGVLDYAGDRGQFIPSWFERKAVYDLSGVETVDGVDRIESVVGTWDLVMACQILEHVPDLRGFLGELRTHGKKFYFEVPLEPFDRVNGVPQLHEHCNFFLDDATLPIVLENAGYDVKKRRVVALDNGYANAAFQQVLAVPGV